MTIYEHRATITASAGSAATTTLRVVGGRLTNIFVEAQTSAATVFRAELIDDHQIKRVRWGWQRQQLNDDKLSFPMVGTYVLQLTNITPTDTFNVVLAVEE